MARKNRDGARSWGLLSELAEVAVRVEWESSAWVMSWTDGPTREMMRDRIDALGEAGFGAPLRAADILLSRRASPILWALAWLVEGGPSPSQKASAAIGVIEARRDEIAYPQRQDPAVAAAARLLAALAGDDEYRMGELLRDGTAPLPSLPAIVPVDFPGKVTSVQWLRGGPPSELLGLEADKTLAEQQLSRNVTQPEGPPRAGNETRNDMQACAWCGAQIPPRTGRGGRPAQYCGGACRTAAHRERRRANA